MTNNKQKRLVLSFVAPTPPQWEKFLKKVPYNLQRSALFPAERTTISDARWRLMCAIQRDINTIVQYKRDPKGNDNWSLLIGRSVTLVGDCEDYVLTKWALMIEAGFPMGSVWPTICKKAGVGHMVLVVSGTYVDYVMDINPHDWVHEVGTSNLEWLTAYDGAQWRFCSVQ